MKFLKSKSKDIRELQPGTDELPGDEEASESEQGNGEVKYGPPDRLPEIKKAAPKPMPRFTAPAAAPQSPPLFIKVDKYRDVVKGIRELRSYILNLRDTLDVLNDMQREVANGIEIAQKSLDELNTIVSNLDNFFMKPQSSMGGRLQEYEAEEDEEPPVHDMRSSMKDVYGQLEKLRAQLRAIQ